MYVKCDRAQRVYRDPEITFSAPPTWQDRSFVAFVAPSADEGSVVMTRVALTPSETVRSYAEALMAELRARVSPRAATLDDRQIEGRAAVCGSAVWRGERKETVAQYFAAISPAAGDPQRQMILLTLTSRAGEALRAAETFDHLLASVRFADAPPRAIIAKVERPRPPPALDSAPLDDNRVPIPGSHGRR